MLLPGGEAMIARKTLFAVGIALLVLLAATALAARVDLGPWNVIVAFAIAVAKAALVIVFFMELKISQRILWIFAGAGFFWLAILAIAVWTDVITRVPIAGR
jgi:cytochrome c oxidase subunit IV